MSAAITLVTVILVFLFIISATAVLILITRQETNVYALHHITKTGGNFRRAGCIQLRTGGTESQRSRSLIVHVEGHTILHLHIHREKRREAFLNYDIRNFNTREEVESLPVQAITIRIFLDSIGVEEARIVITNRKGRAVAVRDIETREYLPESLQLRQAIVSNTPVRFPIGIKRIQINSARILTGIGSYEGWYQHFLLRTPITVGVALGGQIGVLVQTIAQAT